MIEHDVTLAVLKDMDPWHTGISFALCALSCAETSSFV